jgi:predicted heme/steroid binding protein
VTIDLEELSKVEGVNNAIIVLVNGSVGSISRVVVSHLEISLEVLKLSGKAQLLVDDVG